MGTLRGCRKKLLVDNSVGYRDFEVIFGGNFRLNVYRHNESLSVTIENLP
jgi:hypothetical protein